MPFASNLLGEESGPDDDDHGHGEHGGGGNDALPASAAPVGVGFGGKAELPSPTLAPVAADLNTDVPCDEKTPSPKGTFANYKYICIYDICMVIWNWAIGFMLYDIEGPTNSNEIA